MVGKTWKRTYREVNGSRRLVKVRKCRGKYQVRVVGNRNPTDANTRNKRRKFYYSSTDRRPKKRTIGGKLITGKSP